MTCYLILDFRPTYFSYFQKITAISHSHNVKKEGDPKDPFPVVKGLITEIFIDFFNLKNIILICLILISENNVRETLNFRCKELHMISYKNKLIF